MVIISLIKESYYSFINIIQQFTSLEFMPYLLIGIAIIYILSSELRRFTIFRYISIALGFIPTLFHELGHAIMTTLTGGYVQNIHIVLTGYGQKKTESKGFAQVHPKGRLSGILVSFSGYIMPPLILYLGLTFIHKHLELIFILLLGLMMTYYLIKSSQKWIPIVILLFLISSGIELSIPHISITPLLLSVIYNIVLGLCLGETIQAIIERTRLYKYNTTAWDGSDLKQASKLPIIIFYILWLFIDIGALKTLFEVLF